MTPPRSTPKSETVAPPAAAMTSPMVMPTGTRSVTGVATAPATVRYLCVTGWSSADVHQRLDIRHRSVDVLGQAAGRNDAAGDHVHQDELVAGGVTVGQRHDA